MSNFQSSDEFINYIENRLSGEISPTVQPWLKQPAVVQREIIRKLGRIKANTAEVTMEKRIREILRDIEAVTQGPMQEAAVRAIE